MPPVPQKTHLPSVAGVGLKAQHYQTILDSKPAVGWFEIHPENYMGAGGPPHRYLEKIRQDYPLSMHGVGMSLGSADGVSFDHLVALKKLVQRYQPAQVSEHIAWSHWNQQFLNDLLPLPYTRESLQRVCDNLEQVQSFLDCRLLVENPSTYISFAHDDYTETEFLTEVCRRTGCGLLLDVNNVFVSATNNGFDPYGYIHDIDTGLIGEIHLAGHSTRTLSNGKLLRIDDHGSTVPTEVWMLYQSLLSRSDQPLPSLIEWDTDVPALEILLMEARKADARLKQFSRVPDVTR